MSLPDTDVKQTALVQDFAAELSITPEELAATLGPIEESNDLAASTAPAEVPRAAVDNASVSNMDMIMRIPVCVRVVLGSATMPVANLAKLGRGAVIPLDRRVGEPVDVVVNGRVIARGEVVVMDEGNSRFGLKLTEVVGPSAAGKVS
jgi:flagellar motor switch protein FliN/FliY